ncbi:MAG: CDP-archaeol synthase [Clostridia bacterium]|nr:CDP-archaeol synthase [Clostridia bacterium]
MDEVKKITLFRRIVTGAGICIVLVGSLFLSYYISSFFIDALICLLIALCTIEVWRAVAKFSDKRFSVPMIIFAVTTGVVCKLQFLYGNTSGYLFPWSLAYMAIFFFIGVVIAVINAIPADKLVCYAFTLFYPAAIMEFMLIAYSYNASFAHSGVLAMSFIFAVSSGTDIFAYLGGTMFGKHKLCPKFSPNKTVEGAISGIVGGLVGAAVVYLICELSGLIPIESVFAVNKFVIYAIIGFLGGVFNQFGDLLASMIKRYAQVKDYGTALGSHGGFMDRFDGMMFCGLATAIVFVLAA